MQSARHWTKVLNNRYDLELCGSVVVHLYGRKRGLAWRIFTDDDGSQRYGAVFAIALAVLAVFIVARVFGWYA